MVDTDVRAISCRKALKVAVAALATEIGFERAEDSALESMTEMLQSFLGELGKSSQAFAELAGRTESMITDVIMALLDMGQDINKIPAHARRPNKSVFLPPSHSQPMPTLRTLQAGETCPHPSHIPEHLPSFPDPHTYIRTLTNKASVDDYQIIREKASSQKRDVERALTRFIAKTGETQSLFRDDDSNFPLIAIKPTPLPYLNALLPKDQDLDAQDSTDHPQESREMTTSNTDQNTDMDTIDNPYLRPLKVPRVIKKKVILTLRN